MGAGMAWGHCGNDVEGCVDDVVCVRRTFMGNTPRMQREAGPLPLRAAARTHWRSFITMFAT